MDPLALFFSTEGRLTQKQFWLSLLAVYAAGIASQFLLTGTVTARSGAWPFVVVHAAVLWTWTVVHIKRLRDAGRPSAGAYAVAILYGLSVGLALLLVAIIIAPTPDATGQESSAQAWFAFALIAVLFMFLFDGDLGPISLMFKTLALIACLPFMISLAFSLYTGLRRPVP
jgi:uncharacterized membrane protein YhaH (DUF805 family)